THAVDTAVCQFLFGTRTSDVVSAAVSRGFLSREITGSLRLHPLLRTFLHAKLVERSGALLYDTTAAILSLFISLQRWDDAFIAVTELSDSTRFCSLLEQAIEPLLAAGRLATLQEWLDFARASSVDAPITQLAQAHIDQRRGEPRRAELLAVRAACGLTSE